MHDQFGQKINLPTGYFETTLEELEQHVVTHGDVKLWRTDKGMLQLFRAGDVVDLEILKKYIKRKMPLAIFPKNNPLIIQKLVDEYHVLSKRTFENERISTRYEIMKLFKFYFWDNEAQGGLLDLVFCMEKTFLRFDRPLLLEMQKASVELFRRSFLVAALLPSFAIILGYMDFKFLQDLYHIGLLYDYSLMPDELNYNLFSALEMERTRGGKGVDYLKGLQGGEKEVKNLMESGNKLASKAVDRCSEFFHDRGLLYLLTKSHEKFSGTGLPAQICGHEMGDLENLLAMLTGQDIFRLVSYENGKASEFLKQLMTVPPEGALEPTRLQVIVNNELLKITLEKKAANG